MNLRRKRRAAVEPEEIDITSLLDILVILLVFLLKSFNTSELNVDLVNNLALPYSYSVMAPQNGIVVQTDKDKNIYVNNERLVNLNSRNFASVFLDKLSELKEEEEAPKKEGGELINLVFDKRLDYQDIDKILQTVDAGGFKKYKLLTQGKE